MKISYNWLKTLINTTLSAEESALLLTASGLEVESTENFETVQGGFKGLVIGEVMSCEKHPDADRLSVTKVNIGQADYLNIVCGAPNVAAGQKVVVATIGTKLYPTEGEPFEIKKSKIRGAASEGMLCAEDEIGLGKSHAGIMVLPENTTVGQPAADYFKVEKDTVIEIGLTPNRSDAASHLGVARDLAAIINTQQPETNIKAELKDLRPLPDATNTTKVDIEIQATEACKRYSGIVISGVNVGDSPDWIKNRLKAIGLRPINNIVDITNFVLHELGQPLHAFDLEKISGNKIIVRTAKENEKFVTLDNTERTLLNTDLIIADADKPMCIAGVFGGAESGVTEKTTSIFIESAYFDPGFVRKTAKHHALKTDASFRFERGTDPEMTVLALQRAANLVLEIAGGVVSMGVTDIYPEKLEPYKIAFSFSNCHDLIGKEIDRSTVRNIITNLGIVVEKEGNDGLLLSVPRYKTDVTREADVIEEVMRIYGYNNVEVSKNISYTAFNQPINWDVKLENRIAEVLTAGGFYEMLGLSLSSESYYAGPDGLVKVMNPLSNDLNVLRADLLYGGLEALSYNINRKNSDLKLFEIGRTYHLSEKEGEKYEEQKHLSLFVTGSVFAQNAYGLNRVSDLVFLKGVLENLFEKCGVKKLQITESSYSNFEYGVQFLLNNKPFAELGAVSRKQLKNAGINQEVFFADINWSALLKAFSKQKIEFAELSKFPAVRRDLALLIDRSVKFKEIEELAFSTEKKFLQEVNLFDIYEGEKLGNKKSYAVSFTLLNKEATLTDKQIDGVMEKLINNYKEKLGAELR